MDKERDNYIHRVRDMCIHTCQVSHSDNGYVIKFYSTLLCSSSFAVQFSLLLLIFCSDLFTPHLDLSGSRGPLTCWFLTTCSVINTCTTEGVSRGVVGNCVTSVCGSCSRNLKSHGERERNELITRFESAEV